MRHAIIANVQLKEYCMHTADCSPVHTSYADRCNTRTYPYPYRVPYEYLHRTTRVLY